MLGWGVGFGVGSGVHPSNVAQEEVPKVPIQQSVEVGYNGASDGGLDKSRVHAPCELDQYHLLPKHELEENEVVP